MATSLTKMFAKNESLLQKKKFNHHRIWPSGARAESQSVLSAGLRTPDGDGWLHEAKECFVIARVDLSTKVKILKTGLGSEPLAMQKFYVSV